MQRFRKFSYRSLGRTRPTNDLHGKSYLTSILESKSMHVFFLIDTTYCKAEDDDPKDAIVYFYPPQVPESQLCALCCQLTGAVQFFNTTFTCPKIIRCSRGKFAIKLLGRYLLSLGSSSDMPDKKLIQSLDFLLNMFSFYHESLESVNKQFPNDNPSFVNKMQSIWKFFLESACSDERVSWVAEIIPRIENLLPSIYLTAFQLLQSCQRLPHVLAGCITYNNSIVCTQFPKKISSYLCHFQDVLLQADIEQHKNLILSVAFLPAKDLLKVSSMNIYSKTFRKALPITDFNTEATVSGENRETEISDVDSSFEDGSRKSCSPFQSQSIPKCASADNIKCRSETTWLTTSASETAKLTVTDESNISQSFEAVHKPKRPESLTFKSNSLSVLQSVTEASLKSLKLYENNEERPRYRRKKSRKSINSKNLMFLSDGHESKNDTLTDTVAHSENSADSSFFEPKPLLESQHSDVSQKSELLTADNSSSKKYSIGSTTPVFLKISQDISDLQTPKKRKSCRMLNFTFEDETALQTVALCCIKSENTRCFVMLENGQNDAATSVQKMCLRAVEQLNADLQQSVKSTKSVQVKPNFAVYCDHLWNSTVGDKPSRLNHQLNDLQDHPTFKSVTVMNMSGVAYTHSSMTHNIYVENNSTGSSVPGIPSPQDVMARISHLPKQKHDKMGYFLLR